MYYQNYEDYMRAVLGYPIERQNTYSSTNNTNYSKFNDANLAYQNAIQTNFQEDNFLDMYPDIYRIVNPMICKVCENNNEPITKELVMKMTDEVYKNLEETETSTVVNINATLSNERLAGTNSFNNLNDLKAQNRTTKMTQSSQTSMPKSTSSHVENRDAKEVKQIRPRNNLLRDLIQILILKKLLGNNKPSVRPPRPPMQPGSLRPPIRPREYSDYYRF